MRKHFLVPILVGIFALGAAQAFAQSATVVMRNGDRVQAEVLDMGRDFAISVNGQVRRVPIGDIVLIDFAGNGRDISNDEISRANAANGFVVMRNGESFNASLQDFTGKPLIAVFSNGRRSNIGEVSRIYMGSVANVPGFPNQSASNPSVTSQQPVETAGWARRREERARARDEFRNRGIPANAREIVVPSNVQWHNTGLNVSRGQVLRFSPSGEVRLSFGSEDVARPAGAISARQNPQALIPTIPVGALIGRVGNGAPFPIGDTTNTITMPANGRLFLSINDDHHGDNSGNYVVYMWEQ